MKYSNREFRKLQREWYDKLEEGGFYDVEGGVEGHLLKGPSSSVSLRSLANKTQADHGLKHDRAPREFDEVADSSNPDIDFMGGSKARYYHFASLLAAQAFRDGYDELQCYVWQLHAEGDGERVIAWLLEKSRSHIRKYIKHLRYNIKICIDSEHR